MNVHWLIPGGYTAVEELSKSNMASIRMRAGLVAKYAKNLGIKFTAGDIISAHADIVVIGKIGGDCRNGRDNLWISQINEAYQLNKIIILDYTDNHLGDESSHMYEFYNRILPFCSKAVVPSAGMDDLLSNFFNEKIIVIEDPVEIKIIPPRFSNADKDFTLLWFGHGSNISFLLEYLQNDLICNDPFNLVVLTNQYGIGAMSSRQKYLSSKVELTLSEWSMENMVIFSRMCHGCIIPSGVNSLVKSGASSNRLITAFALGLPVSADLLSSYSPFSQYFHHIKASPISEFKDNLDYYYRCAEYAQENFVPMFSEDVISEKWNILFNK